MTDARLRSTILIVALANLAYFGVEFVVALHIQSVALFADSVDFLEDACVNFLILMALSWSLRARARVGMILAGLLLWPALATLWMAWQKLQALTPPDPILLSVTGLGALAVNITCAYLLARYRHDRGSLTKAAFLSARNDAYANITIIIAGILTFATHSPWPDMFVGLVIGAMNFGAAKEVWYAARSEKLEAEMHSHS